VGASGDPVICLSREPQIWDCPVGGSYCEKVSRWGGEIAMAKFYIKRLKTRAILSPSRLIRCICTFRPEPIPGGHHARPSRGPSQSGPGQTRSSARSSTVHTVVVTLPRRAGKKRNDMDSAKRCRDQSAECLRLMKLAHSETEARVLRDLAHSWVRLANQTDRYTALSNSNGPHRAELMPPQRTGVAPRSRTDRRRPA
jgi:hypothetical protein